MKVMRIGSSLINLEGFTSIEGRTCGEGVIITVEHANSIKEYLVPHEIDPELVTFVILESVNNCSNFDLLHKLKTRRAMIGYEEDND